MCIACELGFWSMVDALSPEARARLMQQYENAARLACDMPEGETPKAAAPSEADEPKP